MIDANVALLGYLVLGGVVFGTLSGVVWRQRGGKPSDGVWLGVVFGIFGLAYCSLATPKGGRSVLIAPRSVIEQAVPPPPPPSPPYTWNPSGEERSS